MSRLKEFKEASLPISIFTAVGVGTAVILISGDRYQDSKLSSGTLQNTPDASRQKQSDIAPELSLEFDPKGAEELALEKLNSNFAQTVSWMGIYPNEEVQRVALKLAEFKEEYDEGNKTHLVIINNGEPSQIVSVGNLAGEKNLKIQLSLQGNSEDNRSILDFSKQYFKNYQVYEEAIKNPLRYMADEAYRDELEHQAEKETLEAFAPVNRINLSESL